MKFLLLILTILAVSCVRADQEHCSKERAEACLDNLLTVIMDDNTKEEACREFRSSFNCLKKEVDDCLGDERDSELDEGLEKTEKRLRHKCNADDDKGDSDKDEEMEEIEKCYEQNEDYIMECIYEGTQQAMTLLIGKDDVDENMLKCAMYNMMSGCLVVRVREKCGEKAASMAEDELSDIPEEIAEACNAVGEIDAGFISGINPIGENKRK